jgi:hypothetical protein
MSAESITLESDERGFELHFIVDSDFRVMDDGHMVVNIQACDLDAFYDQVRSRIGPYLRERDEAHAGFKRAVESGGTGDALARSLERYYGAQHGTFSCNPDESAGMADEYAVAVREDGSLRMERDEDAYDPSDPKHENFHSVHADIWDARDGK